MQFKFLLVAAALMLFIQIIPAIDAKYSHVREQTTYVRYISFFFQENYQSHQKHSSEIGLEKLDLSSIFFVFFFPDLLQERINSNLGAKLFYFLRGDRR